MKPRKNDRSITMQKHPEITRARLLSFMAQAKLLERMYPEKSPVQLSVYAAPDRITFKQALRSKYRPAKLGEKFGPKWATHWFKVQVTIPRDWRNSEVHLLWDSSSEACVWIDGVPQQGLTGSDILSGNGRPIRTEYQITPKARGGEKITLFVETACNALVSSEGKEEHLGWLRTAHIARFDRRAWDLHWDVTVLSEIATTLPLNSPRGAQAMFAANAMLNAIDLDEPTTWSKARAIAADYLSVRNGGGQHRISAVGHAHIDTAWLWPVAETRRKCYRTFSSALRYMRDYPEYRFVCSQAQQLAWIKRDHPRLFEQIRQRVKQGRFIPVGGTWVEPDCNIPSGESLIRQFIHGQKFFREQFGMHCPEFWNPDVFGYSGQMPQILRGVGVDYFLTQKLGQNQLNPPRHHTFWWQGIDGSQVLVHFPPADTYIGNCTVAQLQFNVQNYKDLDRSNRSLYLFGYGDGGGGPTMEMLERLRRCSDVDGLPTVQLQGPREFFPELQREAKALTTHVGEIYFENHRGTYTSQARTKKLHRQAEQQLHDVELLAAIVDGATAPAGLEETWQLLLLNEFHDILPGCSITPVHEESQRDLSQVITQTSTWREKSVAKLAGRAGKNVLLVNTLSQPRREVMEIPGKTRPALAIVNVPALGYAVVDPATLQTTDDQVTLTQTGSQFVLENKLVRCVLNADGTVRSLFDKRAQREALAGAGNQFTLFADEPYCYDAWNVEPYHLEKPVAITGAVRATIVERGPLRVAVKFERALTSRSRVSVIVQLDANSPRLDFAAHVHWHERHKFLKVEFPTSVRATEASYEIQFGHVRRPTHFNTSHDVARFEVCAHRFADLSEPGLGVALLNDCKYGYSAHQGTLRLSLLRATKYPDPTADLGEHHFRYALFLHDGSWQRGEVVHAARQFNVPVLVSATNKSVSSQSWFSVNDPGVVIDTVKPSEEGGDVIVRMYEATGATRRIQLQSSLPWSQVRACDLLERDQNAVTWRAGKTSLQFKPFEIRTLRLSSSKV